MKCRFQWHLDDDVVAWLKAEAERRNREEPLAYGGKWDWKIVAMVAMALAIKDEMKEQQQSAVA